MSEPPIINPEPLSAPVPPPVWTAPPRYFPFATYSLIAANAIVFALMLRAGSATHPDVVLDFGASYAPLFRQGQYWRLVMPMFLHLGWLHLGMNMFVLFVLGPLLEEMYGYGRFLVLYVGAGVCGTLASMEFSGNVAAGASGAIMGVAGAILVAGYVHRAALPFRLARIFSRGRLPFTLLIFVVLELVVDQSIRQVDHWGHVGGLAGGALLALAIAPARAAGYGESSGGFSFGSGPPAEVASVSQGIAVIPIAVVAVSMALAASHYPVLHRASLAIERGDRLRVSGDLDHAIEAYRQAQALAPADERPYVSLGLAYAAKRQLDVAAREYQEALRLNPRSPEAGFGLGLIYQSQGKLVEARRMIEKALGTNPQSAEAQAELADLCTGQKLYQQAIDHYREALRLDSRLSVAHNNLAWLYATCDDPKFRDPAQALEHAQRAVELTGGREPEFTDTLAEAYYAHGDYAKAVETQKRTLQLAPNVREFQDRMAKYQEAADGGR